jgi:phage portal protein BeeE
MGQLAREGFERNAVVYRCVRMISEAAGSVGLRQASLGASEAAGELVGLMSRPNGEQAGPDLMESLHGHLVVTGDSFLEAVSIDGEVRELFALRPDRMRAPNRLLKNSTQRRGIPIHHRHRDRFRL